MTEQLRKLVVGTFSSLGFLCIISGVAMPNIIKFENNTVVKLSVSQKQVTSVKNNEIKLATLKLEIGQILSTDSHDYLANPNDIEESIIKRLKLDTSLVNTNEVGSYVYTITYNKKIYNGTIVIVPKELPKIDNITLKQLSFEVNSELPKDIKSYIVDDLPEEVLSAIRLDLSNVNPYIPGKYLYSISYNRNLYTNTITIYEPKLPKTNDETEKTN